MPKNRAPDKEALVNETHTTLAQIQALMAGIVITTDDYQAMITP